MKNWVIWSVILLAIVGVACNRQPSAVEQGKAPEECIVDLGDGVKIELVLIPAGSFMMGSDESSNSKPVHKVTITKPFWLGKYEVTQVQWEAVMGDNPSSDKEPKCPVERVSWDDCQKFLDKLNAKAGGQGGEFVLPTEAQWEYACRAGSPGTFCFGDDERQLGEYAWYETNSDSNTQPVGKRKPNAFGLFDMHGNVWEWCADWYEASYYGASPPDDPPGPNTGSFRAARGGSWGRPAENCRSAWRSATNPRAGTYDLGLRVCRIAADK